MNSVSPPKERRARTKRRARRARALVALVPFALAILPLVVSLMSAGTARARNGALSGTRWKTRALDGATGEKAVGAMVPVMTAARDSVPATVLLGAHTAGFRGAPLSFVFQDFVCKVGEDGNGFCTLSFKVDAWLAATDRAAIVLRTPGDTAAFGIVAPPSGMSAAFDVSARGAGRCRVVLLVWTAAGFSGGGRFGTSSLLRVASTRAVATPDDRSSASLRRLQPEALPLSVEGLSGHLLRTIPPPCDCDDDGTPDVVAVGLQGEPDTNGDGAPDACDGRAPQTNWVLLAMGAVLVAVSLRRIMRSSRGTR